jgi:hypothetical protein
MRRALQWIVGFASVAASAVPASAQLTVEAAVAASDRIVVGTLGRAGVDWVKLPGGGELALGIRDASTGLVFTPQRVRIDTCLLDADSSCRPGDSEFLVPGGTIYDDVAGERRLRTWEVARGAGVSLPEAGNAVVLFLKKRNGRYLPLSDRGAWVPVDRSSGVDSVALRFASPRFMSAQGRAAVQAHAADTKPASTPPSFIETVPLDRLEEVITQVHTVLKPTSGTRHATPVRVDPGIALLVRECGVCIRSGDDALRSDSALELGNRAGPADRPDDGRRECGS